MRRTGHWAHHETRCRRVTQDAHPGAPSGRRVSGGTVWTAIGAIATITGVALPVLGINLTQESPPPAPRVASSPTPRTPSGDLSSGDGPSPTGASSAAAGGCAAADGRPVDCGTDAAGLLVEARPCSDDRVRAALGLTDDAPELLLAVTAQGSLCRVELGPEAKKAGARTVQLRDVARETIPDSLRRCAVSPGGQDVACSQPHRFEYVGTEQSGDREPAADACVQPARRYANRTFASPSDPLAPRVLTWKKPDGFSYRCGIESDRPITRSIWQLGEGDLPAT